MRIKGSQARKPVLVWMAIATAILVAIQRLAVMLVGEEVWPSPGGHWLTQARLTDILVFWSLFLLLGAAYLWREANTIHGHWKAMERALAELEVSYRKLKELEGWRDDLSQFVVHDIKHAVAGIDGSLQLLKRQLGPAVSPETARFLSCACGFTEDLLRLVSTLLDVARLESAGLPLNRSQCDMGTVLAEAVSRMKTMADAKRLTIHVEVPAATLSCDRDLIGRVMLNLLANAIRFAPEGSAVQVRLSVEEREIRVAVTDSGRGVDLALQGRIFDKFAQGVLSDHGGMAGLGLTFCRLAVEAHGGCIGVESPVEGGGTGYPGSRFWFSLPRGVAGNGRSGMVDG